MPPSWSQAGLTFCIRETAEKQGFIPRGPMARLSSSPQAEVSHIVFQPGALHPSFLPPQQRRLHLALCLVPERRGRPRGAQKGKGSCRLARVLADGGPFCGDPSRPQTVSFHHLETPRPTGDLGTHRGKWPSLGPFRTAVCPQASRRTFSCLVSSCLPH